MLVCCWWRFAWSFAHLTAPVVTTTSIILSSNDVQNRDTLVTSLPWLSWKMAVKQVSCRVSVHYISLHLDSYLLTYRICSSCVVVTCISLVMLLMQNEHPDSPSVHRASWPILLFCMFQLLAVASDCWRHRTSISHSLLQDVSMCLRDGLKGNLLQERATLCICTRPCWSA